MLFVQTEYPLGSDAASQNVLMLSYLPPLQNLYIQFEYGWASLSQ